MGYELNLHIGKKVTWDKGERGIIEIAKFDLSKPGRGHLINLINEARSTAERAYLFSSDGDTKIKVDRYGDFLFHIDPKKVLKAITLDHKESPYRVYRLVSAYLRGAITAYKGQELTCIFYGH